MMRDVFDHSHAGRLGQVLAALLLAAGPGGVMAGEPPDVMTVFPHSDGSTQARAAHAPGRAPLVVADTVPVEPLEALPAAAVAAAGLLRAIEEANRQRGEPYRNGFARRLGGMHTVRFDGAPSPMVHGRTADHDGGLLALTREGNLAWTGGITAAGAWMVRVGLSNVDLPAGTLLWAYGGDGIAQGPVDVAAAPEGGVLWAPATAGGTAWLEVQVPPGTVSGSFTIDRVMEIFPIDAEGRPLADPGAAGFFEAGSSCLEDISCAPSTPEIERASRGVGRMLFVKGDFSFICSGGLLNDKHGTGIPYFITAHHCLDTPEQVASVEVWWDYRTAACGGPAPAPVDLEKSFGATFLATGAHSDYTFMQLTSVPPGRFWFGWTTADPESKTLHRVSHPGGGPQTYSSTFQNYGRNGTCGGVPLTEFLYETRLSGGVAGGSSGSPVWIDNDLVVGQLLGGCGLSGDSCDPSYSTVDGRFSRAYGRISAWLLADPAPIAPTDAHARKIKKKKVKLVWTDNSDGEDRFELMRWTGSRWMGILGMKRNKTKVKIKNLLPGTSYVFGVRACKSVICSEISSVEVTTR